MLLQKTSNTKVQAARVRAAGHDALVALARYENGIMPMKYVRSARMAGFDGQIILGVHPELKDETRNELEALDVTLQPIQTTPCKLPYEEPSTDYMLRAVCSAEFPTLKLESARFALARKWIEQCKECSGWVLVSDYGDLVFQRRPFQDLGRPEGLFFVEEYAGKNETDLRPSGRGIDNTYWFTDVGVNSCYGYHLGHTRTLNSGSIVGAKESIIKFLERFQYEFEQNINRGQKCDPTSISDQATLNHLFYSGAFDHLKPKTWRYGDGPIATVGIPCSGPGEPGHSRNDIIRMKDGWILGNSHEPANAVHQDKVCWNNYVVPTVNHRFDHIPLSKVLLEYREKVGGALQKTSYPRSGSMLLQKTSNAKVHTEALIPTPLESTAVPHAVLITGGAGFIGSHLALTILEKNETQEVWIIDDVSRKHGSNKIIEALQAIGGERIKAAWIDLGDSESVKSYLLAAENQIHSVFHFADVFAPESVDFPHSSYQSVKQNTKLLIDALELTQKSVHFYYASSSAVYGSQPALPVTETMDLNPVSLYGQAIAKAENAIRDAVNRANDQDSRTFKARIFRFSNVIGMDSEGRFAENRRDDDLWTSCRDVALGFRTHMNIVGGRLETFDGTLERDFIHVSDLANAILLAWQHDLKSRSELESITHEDAPLFNLGGGHAYSFMEFVDACRKATGMFLPVRFTPYDPTHAISLRSDIARAKEVLDWKPVHTNLTKSLRLLGTLLCSKSPKPYGKRFLKGKAGGKSDMMCVWSVQVCLDRLLLSGS
jgi:UDP-glucose 4-epimerase